MFLFHAHVEIKTRRPAVAVIADRTAYETLTVLTCNRCWLPGRTHTYSCSGWLLMVGACLAATLPTNLVYKVSCLRCERWISADWVNQYWQLQDKRPAVEGGREGWREDGGRTMTTRRTMSSRNRTMLWTPTDLPSADCFTYWLLRLQWRHDEKWCPLCSVRKDAPVCCFWATFLAAKLTNRRVWSWKSKYANLND